MEGLKKGILIKNNVAVGAVGDKYFSNAPIGVIQAFSGNTVPHGYLLADGTSYKVADYPDLYAVIGNTYGGDTENFNVPDYRETVLVGVGENTTDTIASHDVYELGEFKDDQLQDHYHNLSRSDKGMSNLLFYQNNGEGENWHGALTTTLTGKTATIITTSESHTGRGGTTTHGKQKGVTYIIKAFHTNEGVDSGVSDDVINYINNNIKKVIQYENVIQLVNTDYIRTDDIGFTPKLSRTGNIVTLSMRLWCKEVDTPTDIPFKVLDIPDGYKPIDNIYLTAPTNNINKTLAISYTLIDTNTNSVLVRTYNENLNGMQLYFPIMTWITNDELPN